MCMVGGGIGPHDMESASLIRCTHTKAPRQNRSKHSSTGEGPMSAVHGEEAWASE